MDTDHLPLHSISLKLKTTLGLKMGWCPWGHTPLAWLTPVIVDQVCSTNTWFVCVHVVQMHTITCDLPSFLNKTNVFTVIIKLCLLRVVADPAR